MLSAADKQRFARHLLLPEIGVQGQLRLLAATVACSGDGDARATQVARDYLQRAGVAIDGTTQHATDVVPVASPSKESIAQLAGRAELHEAASALAGALCAVEAIKATLGIGTPAALPAELTLAQETSS